MEKKEDELKLENINVYDVFPYSAQFLKNKILSQEAEKPKDQKPNPLPYSYKNLINKISAAIKIVTVIRKIAKGVTQNPYKQPLINKVFSKNLFPNHPINAKAVTKSAVMTLILNSFILIAKFIYEYKHVLTFFFKFLIAIFSMITASIGVVSSKIAENKTIFSIPLPKNFISYLQYIINIFILQATLAISSIIPLSTIITLTTLLTLSFLSTPSISLASDNDNVQDSMSTFWNSLGDNTNYSQAGAYKTQTATYYSGPNLYARSKIVDINPVTIQLPRFRAGCGGIDMFTGSFSHINSDQFVALGKAVASNAKGFVIQLAIDTMAPTISSNIKTILATVEKINQMNLNSCDIATGAVGAVASKFSSASNQFCKTAKSMQGGATDWAKAANECGAGGETAQTIKNNTDPVLNAVKPTNINFAWAAIKNKGIKGELAELFQTLTGTIIKVLPTNDNSPSTTKILPAMADDKKLLDKLLDGGRATIYKCDEQNECLDPKPAVVVIDQKIALKAVIKKHLDSIVTKLEDTSSTLTLQEQELVNRVSVIPIISALKVNVLNLGKEGAIIENEALSNVVAIDLVLSYIQDVFSLIRQGLDENNQGDPESKKQFEEKLKRALDTVSTRKSENYEKFKLSNAMIERIHNIEEILSKSEKGIINSIDE